ncbi:MAG: AraC family transcriptional regulator [Prevotella sp.]|nr:AraC family transcriptional regulator [Prevotella sp.]
MYKLRDFLTSVIGMSHDDVVSDELYCSESDTRHTFLTNQMQETLACYSYTLVHEGWLELLYNGRLLTLQKGDLMIYSPGVQIRIINGSKNYHSVCLIIDEQAALEIPSVRNVVHTAYQPIAELGRPIIHLDERQASHFWQHLLEIIRYQHSNHRYLHESLRTLFTQFVLDLMDAMAQNIGPGQVSERTTELFISFMRLLNTHFIEHHDIGFYADRLHITTIHLSRIVRQITGRTVVDYINQMLLMEASWLLQTTDLSIAAISEHLHFANQSSFGKFFTRMKGINPKLFRTMTNKILNSSEGAAPDKSA